MWGQQFAMMMGINEHEYNIINNIATTIKRNTDEIIKMNYMTSQLYNNNHVSHCLCKFCNQYLCESCVRDKNIVITTPQYSSKQTTEKNDVISNSIVSTTKTRERFFTPPSNTKRKRSIDSILYPIKNSTAIKTSRRESPPISNFELLRSRIECETKEYEETPKLR
jgi:hypothetical protein